MSHFLERLTFSCDIESRSSTISPSRAAKIVG